MRIKIWTVCIRHSDNSTSVFLSDTRDGALSYGVEARDAIEVLVKQHAITTNNCETID